MSSQANQPNVSSHSVSGENADYAGEPQHGQLAHHHHHHYEVNTGSNTETEIVASLDDIMPALNGNQDMNRQSNQNGEGLDLYNRQQQQQQQQLTQVSNTLQNNPYGLNPIVFQLLESSALGLFELLRRYDLDYNTILRWLSECASRVSDFNICWPIYDALRRHLQTQVALNPNLMHELSTGTAMPSTMPSDPYYGQNVSRVVPNYYNSGQSGDVGRHYEPAKSMRKPHYQSSRLPLAIAQNGTEDYLDEMDSDDIVLSAPIAGPGGSSGNKKKSRKSSKKIAREYMDEKMLDEYIQNYAVHIEPAQKKRGRPSHLNTYAQLICFLVRMLEVGEHDLFNHCRQQVILLFPESIESKELVELTNDWKSHYQSSLNLTDADINVVFKNPITKSTTKKANNGNKSKNALASLNTLDTPINQSAHNDDDNIEYGSNQMDYYDETQHTQGFPQFIDDTYSDANHDNADMIHSSYYQSAINQPIRIEDYPSAPPPLLQAPPSATAAIVSSSSVSSFTFDSQSQTQLMSGQNIDKELPHHESISNFHSIVFEHQNLQPDIQIRSGPLLEEFDENDQLATASLRVNTPPKSNQNEPLKNKDSAIIAPNQQVEAQNPTPILTPQKQSSSSSSLSPHNLNRLSPQKSTLNKKRAHSEVHSTLSSPKKPEEVPSPSKLIKTREEQTNILPFIINYDNNTILWKSEIIRVPVGLLKPKTRVVKLPSGEEIELTDRQYRKNGVMMELQSDEILLGAKICKIFEVKAFVDTLAVTACDASPSLNENILPQSLALTPSPQPSPLKRPLIGMIGNISKTSNEASQVSTGVAKFSMVTSKVKKTSSVAHTNIEPKKTASSKEEVIKVAPSAAAIKMPPKKALKINTRSVNVGAKKSLAALIMRAKEIENDEEDDDINTSKRVNKRKTGDDEDDDDDADGVSLGSQDDESRVNSEDYDDDYRVEEEDNTFYDNDDSVGESYEN